MSALPTSVEAIKNERTGKLFIVLDWDVGDNKLKVINPNGDVLDVIKLIFKMDEPIKVQASKFHSDFTEAQVAKLARWEQDQFEEIERKKLEKAARSSQKSRVAKTKPAGGAKTPRARAGSTRKEGLIDRKVTASGKRPVAQWEASQLTFFRHRIESLKPNEVFSIVLEGQGTFQITKSEFNRVFNNVVMNAEYRNQGVFKYDEIPEAAKAFIQS